MDLGRPAALVDLGGSADLTPAARDRLSCLAPGALDVLFTPAETVSTLYAYALVHGDRGDAASVVAAHRAGVHAAQSYLDREAAWAVTNVDPATAPRQVARSAAMEALPADPCRIEQLLWRTAGNLARPLRAGVYAPAAALRVTQLDHDTADPDHGELHGDPFVHSHLVIDARVLGADDGREYLLDLATVHRELPAATALYEATYEAALTRALGVAFDRDDASAHGEVRGIERRRFPGDRCVLAEGPHQVRATM